MEIHSLGDDSFHGDRQTDETKLIDPIRNVAICLKIESTYKVV